MTVTFGVHTGPQNTTIEDLTDLWRRTEQGPFDWISIWDHFYGADRVSTSNFEAVALHTALAMTTSRVRVGCLVYCAAYRSPVVLAKAATTIDHLSGGRCDIGIGAGWAKEEYRAFGIEYPRPKGRLDLLEESAEALRLLLHHPEVPANFTGTHVQLDDAVNLPAPRQPRLPIWIGGGGEQRTLRIAARLADGWNVPFISPEDFEHKAQVLDRHCESVDRDPAAIRRSINLGAATDEASLQRQFGELADGVRAGVLMGSHAQMVEAIGRYVDAGVDQINLALRAPFELGALEAVAAAIETWR